MNTLQIKDALIKIAEEKGRPHYEVSVVRDVIQAFKLGLAHPLKYMVARKIGVSFKHVPVVKKAKTSKTKTGKAKSLESKREILELAGHGTLTKFRCGCRCEECLVWA
ncbi:hypothetical protein [Acinetobacter rudis]|uniref:Uncharacterized protein n=1 Tax=Acinetobacter rudis TaxID=632955 RepID=A0AAW8JDL5_9GAMM|nr:hypothetical protein [Acinetobacter rudis]MDQ8937037.1 hypothetical protein [Acinetobacter rudis]MDQ9019242.1 hypothetical protein [Acinetobacter rudis]